MLPQLPAYTPSLYLSDSFGRYRKYPHNVDTPIPGAGYHVGKMAWAEQQLNLDGSSQPQHYGDYEVVPLRGLGQDDSLLTLRRSDLPSPEDLLVEHLPSVPDMPEVPEETNWTPWLVGIAAAAAVGGGAYYMMRRRKLAANRQRRRRRRRR